MGATRRTFLRWATGLGSILSGILIAGSSLFAFLSPAMRRSKKSRWIKLGEVDQFETGVPVRFDFSESVSDAWLETRMLRGVWIYTEDGKAFTVYNGRCTHLGCSFAFVKERERFECPCHHGMFEPKTGAVLAGPPPRPLDTLETKIEQGILYAAYQDFRGGVAEKVAAS